MCTLIVSYRELPEWPLFLAGNRDEFFDRPTDTPGERTPGERTPGERSPRNESAASSSAVKSGSKAAGSSPAGSRAGGSRATHARWLGPLDELAGGTWIGVNEHRLVAVLTNRTDQPPATSENAPLRSRGLLVRGILEQPSADAALELLRQDAHNPSESFNLIFGTPRALFLAERTDRLVVRQLDPGSFAVSNHGPPGNPSVPEVRRAELDWKAKLANLTEPACRARAGLFDPFDSAREILTDPNGTSSGPSLVKSEHADRGTRSSTLIGISADHDIQLAHWDFEPSVSPTEARTRVDSPTPRLDWLRGERNERY